MGIVHSALRRDLERTRVTLGTAPYPEGPQRRAIADHLLAMLHFLHVHHSGEDRGLWPALLRKDPDAVELVDRMERDHEAIDLAIGALEATAAGYRDGTVGCDGLLAALDGLAALLLPHLEREETEAMPVVAATLTDAEWRAWEQEHAVRVKTFVELGDEGHWILDGLSRADRRVMLGVVPAVPRFVLVHGFARRDRRKRALLCGDGPASRIPSLDLLAMRERS